MSNIFVTKEFVIIKQTYTERVSSACVCSLDFSFFPSVSSFHSVRYSESQRQNSVVGHTVDVHFLSFLLLLVEVEKCTRKFGTILRQLIQTRIKHVCDRTVARLSFARYAIVIASISFLLRSLFSKSSFFLLATIFSVHNNIYRYTRTLSTV